jgi:ATP-dependent DNA ligase
MKLHDGFRIMARRDGAGSRLITRHDNDFTSRFPIIVAAVTALPAQSFLIDGEAIVTNGDGLFVFDLIRHKRHGGAAVLCAFTTAKRQCVSSFVRINPGSIEMPTVSLQH